MFLSIIFFILSIIPSILIVKWLKNRRKDDLAYQESCKSAIARGLVAVLPIIAVSGVLALTENVLKATILQGMNILVYEAMHTFIVLAFAEELVKFTAFKLLLKKRFNDYSWADVTAYMVIIGTVFGLVEDLPYAIGSSPMVMLVRGITMGHVGYGFVMGWFYGKSLYTGDKKYAVMAFVIPFLVHGLYDFSLTPELLQLNDNYSIIAFVLALLDLVLLFLMIRFFRRSRKKEHYNRPLSVSQGQAS